MTWKKAALKVITIPQNNADIDEMVSDGYDSESITSTFKAHLKNIVAEYSMMRKMNGSSNIVNCDDVRYVQHDDGIGWDIYIKMELLTPLNKALPVQVDEKTVIKVGRDLCGALELCRKHEIVHRDIKPQNIFVSENGDYKLGDFGIARTMEKTMGGTRIGTLKFMAPEVYNNQPYGSASDIYAVGLVLYWLLNQRRMPFLPLPPARLSVGMEEQAGARRLSGEKLPAPAHGSAELQRIVLKACAFDPRNRYATATEMLTELRRLEMAFDAHTAVATIDSEATVVLPSKENSFVQPIEEKTTLLTPETAILSSQPTIEEVKPEPQVVPQPITVTAEKGNTEPQNAEYKPFPKGTAEFDPAAQMAAAKKREEKRELFETAERELAAERKKRKHIIMGGLVLVVVLVALLIAFMGKNVQRITIAKRPDRCMYELGDTLDVTGLEIKVEYSDNTDDTIDDGFKCYPTAITTAGIQVITVSYGGHTTEFEIVGMDSNHLSSGVSGNNFTWLLTKEGELTIVGRKSGIPSGLWEKHKSTINTIHILEGLSRIDSWMFSFYTQLSIVAIPSTVERIEKGAFHGCSNLHQLTILNKDCEIYEDSNTLGVPGTTTIRGYKGSTAQAYAEKCGYTFEPLVCC